MRIIPAIFLGCSLLVAQLMHGGAMVPGLAWPAYGVLLAAAVAALGVAWRSPSPPAPSALLVAGTVCALLLVRSFAADDFLLARVDGVCILAGALAFLVAATLPDAASRLGFLSVLFLAVLGQAGVGTLQMASDGDYSAVHWFSSVLREFYEGKFSTRVHGTFLNPNHLAWFAGTVALFLTSLVVWGRFSWPWRLILGFLALGCIALEVLTASRGGLVSLAGGFAVMLVLGACAAMALSKRVVGGGAILLGSLAALVLAGGVAAAALGGSWTAQGRMATFAMEFDVRGQLFHAGSRAWQAEPLLGHGPGSFIHLARLYREGRHQSGDPIFAHNDWLQLLVEYGFAGFAIFVLGFAFVCGGGVMRFARVVCEIRENRVFAASNTAAILLGAIAAVTTMAMHSYLDFNLRIPANALLAGAVLGLLTNPDPRATRSRRSMLVARGVNVVLLAIFTGTLGLAAARFATADWQELEAENARARGAVRRADAAISRGLMVDPDNSRLLQVRARMEFARAMSGMTRDSYGRARRLFIDELAEGSSGGFGVGEGELAQAHASYKRLVELSPHERSVFAEYGRVLVWEGQEEKAKTVAIEAVARDPRHAYAFIALGDVLLDGGHYEEALRAYRVGASLPGAPLSLAKFEAIQELGARETGLDERGGAE